MIDYNNNFPTSHGNSSKFHGNLNQDMTLTDIFQTLSVKFQYGWLYLRNEENEICLYFEGDLVGLVTPPEEKLNFIPDKLLYAGKIDEALYNTIVNSEDPFKTLEENVPEDEILKILSTICYEEICDIFNWEEGYFEFISKKHPEANEKQEPIGRLFEIEGILLEVTRREQERDIIWEKLPPMEEIFIQQRNLDFPHGKDDPMGNVWNLANYRSLQEILNYSYFSQFDTCNIIITLLEKGYNRLLTSNELSEIAFNLKNEGKLEEAIKYYNLLFLRGDLNIQECESYSECYSILIEKEQKKYEEEIENIIKQKENEEKNLTKLYKKGSKEYVKKLEEINKKYELSYMEIEEKYKENKEKIAKYKEKLGELYSEMANRLINSNNLEEKIYGAYYLKKFGDLFMDTPEGIEALLSLFFFMLKEDLNTKGIFKYNPRVEGKKLFHFLRSKKEDEKAKEVLEALLEVNPHDEELQNELINVCIDLKDFRTAIAIYESRAKIYERDKEWDKLISTYQSIMRLLPVGEREEVKRKIDKVLRRKNFWKRFAVNSFILLLICGVSIAGWYGYKNKDKLIKYLNTIGINKSTDNHKNNKNVKISTKTTKKDKNNKNNSKENKKIDEVIKKRQKEIDKKAEKNLEKAIQYKLRGNYLKAKEILKNILATLPSQSIKNKVQRELWEVDIKIKNFEKTKKEFFKIYKKAKKLEKENNIEEAIKLYLELWNNEKYKNIKEYKKIYIPLYIKTYPSSCKIFIDGKEKEKEKDIIYCSPNFREICIKRLGFKEYYLYNSLNNPYNTEIKTKNSKKYFPLTKGIIKIKLEKSTLWEKNLSEKIELIDSTPYYYKYNKTLYIASRDDTIYALQNLSSKSPYFSWKWKPKIARLSSFTASPVIYKNILYIGGNNGKFYAIDIKNKKLIGVYYLKTKAFINYKCIISKRYKRVIFGAIDGKVYALPLIYKKTYRWKPIWIYNTYGKIDSPINIKKYRVIVGNIKGYLICLSIRGKLLWKRKIGIIKCEPYIYKYTVYVVSNNYFRALSLKSGKLKWKVFIGDNCQSGFTLHKDILYFGTDGKRIYGISLKEKRIVWEYKGISTFRTKPLISNKDILYIGSEIGVLSTKERRALLYAIDLYSAKELWTYKFKYSLRASPIIINNILIQCSDKIYAFLLD